MYCQSAQVKCICNNQCFHNNLNVSKIYSLFSLCTKRCFSVVRYPNSHTHYFSCTLLYLFAEANQESIQEQITRVLLERLIVNRPHPWGKSSNQSYSPYCLRKHYNESFKQSINQYFNPFLGLLITFIELIKNPSYKFWEHEFVHCAPEIQKLFESVARSCMVSKILAICLWPGVQNI